MNNRTHTKGGIVLLGTTVWSNGRYPKLGYYCGGWNLADAEMEMIEVRAHIYIYMCVCVCVDILTEIIFCFILHYISTMKNYCKYSFCHCTPLLLVENTREKAHVL